MFKIWIHIEEIDSHGESEGDAIEPVELGEFKRLEDAEARLERAIDQERCRR